MLEEEVKKMAKPSKREWTKIDKKIVFFYFFVHVGCIFAPFHFNWSAFWIAFSLHIITVLFGITISYHRNLSHRSFKLPKLIEYLFAYCGLHALEGDPIKWVSTHRSHHQFIDTKNDPHSPIHGFLFSHMTWLFYSKSYAEKVCPKYFNKYGRANNVGDLEKEAFYRFIHKTHLLHPLALAILLYVLGGFPYLIWRMCVRIVTLWHLTFMVNSVCHKWGNKQWKNADLSTNNWLIGLLGFGEGWHNNHHAFEYSAQFGLEWWQIDFGWYVIMFLQAIGVATNVKVPSQIHKQKMAITNQNTP